MADRLIGYGTTASHDLAGGSTFAAVSLITDCTPPATEFEMVDVTGLADTRMKNVPGQITVSPFTIGMMFEPSDTVHASYRTTAIAKTEVNWRVTWTDASTWTFKGYISAFVPGQVLPNQKITATMTIHPTENPTVA